MQAQSSHIGGLRFKFTCKPFWYIFNVDLMLNLYNLSLVIF